MLWIILAVSLLALFYAYLTVNHNYWKKKNVPYEPPIPLFGNFLNVALRVEGIGSVIKRVYDKFDAATPYFGMYFCRNYFLVIKSEELLKNVLVRDFSFFPNRPSYADDYVDKWSNKTLLTLRNEEWKSLRNKLALVFTSGRMKQMINLMQGVSDELEEFLHEKKGQVVDVRELSKRYFIDIICKCVFGIQPDKLNDDNSYIRSIASRLINIESCRWIFALIVYFICPILVRICGLQFVDSEAAEYLVAIFVNSYKRRKDTNVKTNDLIDILHNLQQEDTENDFFYSDDMKLSAQALVFFQAGSEPAAGILSFCLYELAANKEIQHTLREEIRSNINDQRTLSYDTLMEMTYLDLVLKEALRKYPLVQILFRLVEKDYTLDDGLKLDKGTNVVIPMLALHYDPKYYPDPQKFDPERFRGDKMKELQYVYLPFGEGPRKCIGYRFAVMSLKLALAMFLKDFEVSLSEKTQVPLQLNTTSFFITPATGTIDLKLSRIY